MAIKKNPKRRIRQISVGFEQRQLDFLDNNLHIDIHQVCRKALDEQMEIMGDENENR